MQSDRLMMDKAIRLAEPIAVAILEIPGVTWGPKWVTGLILFWGELVPFSLGEDPSVKWNDEWGSPLGDILITKERLSLIARSRMTRVIAERNDSLFPDCRGCADEWESLFSGSAHCTGTDVVCIGAKGAACTAIAEIILVNIKLLTILEADQPILLPELKQAQA